MWRDIDVTIFEATKQDARNWRVISKHFLNWKKNRLFQFLTKGTPFLQNESYKNQ